MTITPSLRGVLRTDLRARVAYSEGAGIYRIIPAAVAIPADAGDVATLLRWAGETGQCIVPRGAGSGMGGGNVGAGIVMDLTALGPRVLRFDAASRTITASAGVTLSELELEVASRGLRLPPDPSSSRWATSAGVFSTNAAGPRTLRYGAMRRWAVGARIITGEADTLTLQRAHPSGSVPAALRFESTVAPSIRAHAATVGRQFPRTAKNSSGYALDAWLASGDLLDLFIGAEGTLGVITEVTWRLDAIPPFRGGMRVEVQDLDSIADLIRALIGTGPSICELLDRTFLDVVRDGGIPVPDAQAVLLLEYEAASADALDAALDAGSTAAAATGAVARRPGSPEEESDLWTLRHAASPILARLPATQRSMQVVEDGCVPVPRLAEYLRLLRDAASRRGLRIVLFGHAGDGHVHANLLPDVTQPGWTVAVSSLLDEVSSGLIAMGGTPAGEHGDGRLRARVMEQLYGPEVVNLFRQVKNCFDPLGILNPGVILPADASSSPLSQLKVGSEAAEIPDDVAAGLRRIEREGGYGTPRLELA